MIEEMINKTLDYTRGNNTYLECVNNNLEYATRALNNMEYGLRSDIQDLRSDVQSAAVGLYNMGLGIRDDIQTSTAMNINAIQGMAMGLRSDIRDSTYTIVASQNMLNQTFKQGFSSVNNTINLGFGLVGNKIDVLSEEISSKLDEIKDILNNPRLTASRELYRQALISYKKGFYKEALEDCIDAVGKNKTDYISWYLLGLIYLFGAGKNGNVINLDKAEEAFDNARMYIEPEMPKSEEAQLMSSEIFYHLGFTRLAKSNDYLIENKADESNTKLLEAKNASSMAYQLSKENLIAGYEYAKELHFLGKDDESLKLLEELIRKEKNFAIKVVNDKNFESLWGEIDVLILRLRDEIVGIISQKCNDFRALHNTEHRENKLSRLDIPDQSQLEIFEHFYRTELNKNDSLKHSVCHDFDNLAKEILHKDKIDIKDFKYKDVFDVERMIKNIREGKNLLTQKLDKISNLVGEVLCPFESLSKQDYFTVLQKEKEYAQIDNLNKLKKLSSVVIDMYIEYDNTLKILTNNSRNMFLYLTTQKSWEENKVKLKEKYIDNIETELREICDTWGSTIENLKQDISNIRFPEKADIKKFQKFYYTKLKKNSEKNKTFNSLLNMETYRPSEDCDVVIENISNGKDFIINELDIISSRIEDVGKAFEIQSQNDYFFVLEKYNKLNEGFLQATQSYFNYSLSKMKKEVKKLSKDVLCMQGYFDAYKLFIQYH